MTLDDLERLNRGFMDFLAILSCETLFKSELLKLIEIDIDKLHMKLVALNVDLDGSSLDFVGSRKPAHDGIKERYSRKSHYFTIVHQSFVKTAGDGLTVCEQELL